MGVAPSRVKEGTGEGQTTDGWQLEGTVEVEVDGIDAGRRPKGRSDSSEGEGEDAEEAAEPAAGRGKEGPLD